MIARRTLLASALCLGFAPEARAQADDGPPLPPALGALGEVALTTPAGAATTLGAQLNPGPAVISFWATWCAPCIMEARHLSAMRTRIAPERLNIIGVNVDRNRDEARLADFLRRGRVNYTQVRGDLAAYQAFGGGEQILLPRLFVFDASGAPTAAFGRYFGNATLRQIDRAVERAMGVA
jgi:thiol-disulfide isomerase/thioredoxin